MNEGSENGSHRKTFQFLALLGPALFLEKLVPPDQLPEYIHFSRENSRNFLLLKLLTEVQKVGFAFERWNEYLDRCSDSTRDNAETQNLDSLIDEQSLWQRKLLEGLVLLVNFSSTNELVYYYHILLLHELRHYTNRRREQVDFFQHGNALTERTIDLLIDRIEAVEREIVDLSDCWYLSETKNTRRRKQRTISSLRAQLKNALKICSDRERRAFGYTYDITYGETSNNIHFSTTRKDYADLKERFSFGLAQCGLLSTAIIKRAHDLVDIKPIGVNSVLARTDNIRQLEQNSAIDKQLEIGDFILADGRYLGELVGFGKSKYGYKSYRVRYLADSPVEGIEEAWFPALHVQPFMSRSEMLKELKSKIQEDFRENKEAPPEFTDSEIQSAVHKAVIELWTKGVGAYIKRVASPKLIGDQGLGYVPEH